MAELASEKNIVIRTLEERITTINLRRKQLKVDIREHLTAAASARGQLIAFDKQVGDLRAAIMRETKP